MVEKLFRGVARGGAAPVTATLTLPLDSAAIARQTGTLVPLSVALTLARRRRTASRGSAALCERVRSPLMPWPRSSVRPAAQFSWARRAEAALIGCAGFGSGFVLARPLRKTKTPAQIWALRWGGAQGVALSPDDLPPITVVQRPFAVDLLRGEVAATIWSDAMAPEVAQLTYVDIDVDAVFGRIVAILGELTAPDRAAAFRRADPRFPARVEAARNAATRVFARQLIPATNGQLDPEAAIDVPEEMARAVRESIADIGSSWVRYRFAARESGVRLRLSGVVTGVPSRLGGEMVPADLVMGDAPLTRLDFPVAPQTDTRQPRLSLRPTWRVSGIECLDNGDDARPASRLVPLLPAARREKGNLALGTLDLPSISSCHPDRVCLVEQQAIGPDSPTGQTLAGLIAEATRWSFAFTIARGELTPRDDVWLRLAFNRLLVVRPTATAAASALTPLAAGLLRFEAGYASLAPLMTESGAKDAVLADALGRIITSLTEDLTYALALPAHAPTDSPAVEDGCIWVWRDLPNTDGSRSLFVRVDPTDASGPHFPMVAGCLPLNSRPAPADHAPGAGKWCEALYHLPESVGAGALPFVLDRLGLLSHQAVAIDARVARNLGSGLDPKLARTTDWTRLGPVVTAMIDLPMPLAAPFDGASLEQWLAMVLDPFCKAGNRIGGERTLRIDLVQKYPLELPDGQGRAIGSMPILSTSLSPDHGTHASEIAATLVESCLRWREASPQDHDGAWLTISAELRVDLAGTSVPLFAVRQLDLPAL